ncbi:MAG: hypothetical protein H0V41_11215 [Pseudonocardiales bacterium]|nr:hypothetical protein [Pseudonocardiales bacterium]
MDVLIIYVAAVDLCTVSVPYGPFCVGVISERQHHRDKSGGLCRDLIAMTIACWHIVKR